MILLPTTGGGMNQTTKEKLIPIRKLKPEMCSFNPAPFNFGIFQIASRFEEFKYDWEKEYLDNCKRVTFAPTFNDDICPRLEFADFAIICAGAVADIQFHVYVTGDCILHGDGAGCQEYDE